LRWLLSPRTEPGDEDSAEPYQRRHQQGGAIPADGGDASSSVGALGDRHQGRHPDGGADLPGGVHHSADQTLVRLRHAAGRHDRRAKAGADGAESNEYDEREQRAVMTTRREVRQDEEADAGGRRRHHQQCPHAKSADEASTEHAGEETGHPLWGNHQSGDEWRVV
jgi:hypothetical protein